MKKQKELTFFEAIAEARKGAVIGIVDGPVMYWDSLSEILKFHSDDVDVAITRDILDRRYQIIDPAPTPKVKVALYAYRVIDGWKLSDAYYIDDADFMKNSTLSTKDFKRIDWSEMEVDG